MASSSDESSRAPENFQVSGTSNDEDDLLLKRLQRDERIGGTVVNSEGGATAYNSLKCPLCDIRKQNFLCRSCVNGAKKHQHTENFNEKRHRYLNVKSTLKTLGDRYEHLIREQKSCENIRFHVKRKKEEIALLVKLLTEKRARLQTLTKDCDRLRRINEEKRKILDKYPSKVEELQYKVLDHKAEIERFCETRENLLISLQQVRQQYIHELVHYAFPISEIVLKDERRRSDEMAVQNATSAEESETIAALADAKNTSYIRGKWVIHGSGISEMQYCIVAPSLPANGDYSSYLEWLKENKDDVPRSTSNEVAPSRVTAYRIVGALIYTAQLTQLLAFYLNVRLPFRCAYGDFCQHLNKTEFLRNVACLNSNIMYLAYTQQVQLRSLNENHTLENIMTILDVDKNLLGRDGYCEVTNAPLQKSIDSVLIGIETATESEGEDEQSQGWETLPNLTPGHDIIVTPTIVAAQQPTIAQGLMTSIRYFADIIKPK